MKTTLRTTRAFVHGCTLTLACGGDFATTWSDAGAASSESAASSGGSEASNVHDASAGQRDATSSSGGRSSGGRSSSDATSSSGGEQSDATSSSGGATQDAARDADGAGGSSGAGGSVNVEAGPPNCTRYPSGDVSCSSLSAEKPFAFQCTDPSVLPSPDCSPAFLFADACCP